MSQGRSASLVFAAIVGFAFVALPAQAVLVDYPGVPAHAGHVAWQDGNGFHHHHYHDTTHVIDGNGQPDAQTGHDIGHTLSGTATNEADGDYDAYSVWVNRTYMVFDGSGGGAAQGGFSHGFIIEQNPNIPRYQYVGSNNTLFDTAGDAFDPRPYVDAAFSTWSALTTDDPNDLIMGLEFVESVSGAHEITVSFVDFIAGAVAAWSPGTRTLEFRRYDDAAATIKHPYYIGANAAGIPNNANTNDMLTVALHEVGHIVGLDHQSDSDDVMYTFASRGNVIQAGGVFRDLSFDDYLGAQDLYSIPVPEPSTIVLFGMSLAGLGLVARRRREAA